MSGTENIGLSSLLSFAGFADFEIEAIDIPQQFAEKLHAITRPWDKRENTRVKDLADVVVFINLGLDPPNALNATEHVFAVRGTHPVPEELPDPPLFWNEDYPPLAQELNLTQGSIPEAMETLREFWAEARDQAT